MDFHLILVLISIICTATLTRGGPVHRQESIGENVYITFANNSLTNENRVCVIEGIEYEASDMIPTSDPCEHCTCHPPGFACTIINCNYKSGCKAIKRSNQCCPEYKCECEKDGRIFQNGEKVIDPDNPCKVCYCQGGEIRCITIECFWRNDCKPRYIENRCCPVFDHCLPLGTYRPGLPIYASVPPSTSVTTLFSTLAQTPSPTPELLLIEEVPLTLLPQNVDNVLPPIISSTEGSVIDPQVPDISSAKPEALIPEGIPEVHEIVLAITSSTSTTPAPEIQNKTQEPALLPQEVYNQPQLTQEAEIQPEEPEIQAQEADLQPQEPAFLPVEPQEVQPQHVQETENQPQEVYIQPQLPQEAEILPQPPESQTQEADIQPQDAAFLPPLVPQEVEIEPQPVQDVDIQPQLPIFLPQDTENQSQEPEFNAQEAVIQTENPELLPQVIEIQSQLLAQEPEIQPQEPELQIEEADTQPQEPTFLPPIPQEVKIQPQPVQEVEIQPQVSTLLPQEVHIQPQAPALLPEEVEIQPQEPELLPQDVGFQSEDSTLLPEPVDVQTQKPSLLPQEVEIQPELPVLLPQEAQIQPESALPTQEVKNQQGSQPQVIESGLEPSTEFTKSESQLAVTSFPGDTEDHSLSAPKEPDFQQEHTGHETELLDTEIEPQAVEGQTTQLPEAVEAIDDNKSQLPEIPATTQTAPTELHENTAIIPPDEDLPHTESLNISSDITSTPESVVQQDEFLPDINVAGVSQQSEQESSTQPELPQEDYITEQPDVLIPEATPKIQYDQPQQDEVELQHIPLQSDITSTEPNTHQPENDQSQTVRPTESQPNDAIELDYDNVNAESQTRSPDFKTQTVSQLADISLTTTESQRDYVEEDLQQNNPQTDAPEEQTDAPKYHIQEIQQEHIQNDDILQSEPQEVTAADVLDETTPHIKESKPQALSSVKPADDDYIRDQTTIPPSFSDSIEHDEFEITETEIEHDAALSVTTTAQEIALDMQQEVISDAVIQEEQNNPTTVKPNGSGADLDEIQGDNPEEISDEMINDVINTTPIPANETKSEESVQESSHDGVQENESYQSTTEQAIIADKLSGDDSTTLKPEYDSPQNDNQELELENSVTDTQTIPPETHEGNFSSPQQSSHANIEHNESSYLDFNNNEEAEEDNELSESKEVPVEITTTLPQLDFPITTKAPEFQHDEIDSDSPQTTLQPSAHSYEEARNTVGRREDISFDSYSAELRSQDQSDSQSDSSSDSKSSSTSDAAKKILDYLTPDDDEQEPIFFDDKERRNNYRFNLASSSEERILEVRSGLAAATERETNDYNTHSPLGRIGFETTTTESNVGRSENKEETVTPPLQISTTEKEVKPVIELEFDLDDAIHDNIPSVTTTPKSPIERSGLQENTESPAVGDIAPNASNDDIHTALTTPNTLLERSGAEIEASTQITADDITDSPSGSERKLYDDNDSTTQKGRLEHIPAVTSRSGIDDTGDLVDATTDSKARVEEETDDSTHSSDGLLDITTDISQQDDVNTHHDDGNTPSAPSGRYDFDPTTSSSDGIESDADSDDTTQSRSKLHHDVESTESSARSGYFDEQEFSKATEYEKSGLTVPPTSGDYDSGFIDENRSAKLNPTTETPSRSDLEYDSSTVINSGRSEDLDEKVTTHEPIERSDVITQEPIERSDVTTQEPIERSDVTTQEPIERSYLESDSTTELFHDNLSDFADLSGNTDNTSIQPPTTEIPRADNLLNEQTLENRRIPREQEQSQNILVRVVRYIMNTFSLS